MGKTAKIRFAGWTELDEALRRIAEIDREVSVDEAELNREIDELKGKYAAKAETLEDERRGLVKAAGKFCDFAIHDFGGKKSMERTYGTVGFRSSARLVIHSVENTIAAIKAKYKRRAARFLIVKESINKEALEGLADAQLSALGVTRSETEKFFVEPKVEKLEGALQ